MTVLFPLLNIAELIGAVSAATPAGLMWKLRTRGKYPLAAEINTATKFLG